MTELEHDPPRTRPAPRWRTWLQRADRALTGRGASPDPPLPPFVRRGARVADWVFAALACGLIGLWSYAPIFNEASHGRGQWDFDAYFYGSRAYESGRDAYDGPTLVELSGGTVKVEFLYPAHTLAFFDLFGTTNVAEAKRRFLAFKVIVMALLILLWARGFVEPGLRHWFVPFALWAFHAFVIDLRSGNVGTFTAAAVWIGIAALMRDRLWLFVAAIIAAAQFKAMPILFLGLVLLTKHRDRGRVFIAGVCAALVVYAGAYLWDPTAAQTYIAGLAKIEAGGPQWPSPSSLAFIRVLVGRIGISTVGLIGRDPAMLVPVASLLYGAWVVAVGVLTLRAVCRTDDVRTRVYLGVLAYAIAAPRMPDYSWALAILPTFELLRTGVRDRRLGVGIVLLIVAFIVPELSVVWPYRAVILGVLAWTAGLSRPAIKAR